MGLFADEVGGVADVVGFCAVGYPADDGVGGGVEAAAADELVCAGGGGLERLGGVNDEAALV